MGFQGISKSLKTFKILVRRDRRPIEKYTIALDGYKAFVRVFSLNEANSLDEIA